MSNFTKKEIIKEVSDQLGITQALSSRVFHAILDIIGRELIASNTVVIRDFGTFETRVAKGRPGRNPRKPDQTVQIPDRAVVKFLVGKALKENVAGTIDKLQAQSAK